MKPIVHTELNRLCGVSDPVRAAIGAAATESYELLSKALGIPKAEIVEKPGDCGNLSLVLQQLLLQSRPRIATRVMSYSNGRHFFLEGIKKNQGVIADGTWQQMLPAELRGSDLPDILITKRDRLVAVLALLQMPDVQRATWVYAESSSYSRQNCMDEKVRALLNHPPKRKWFL